MRTTLILTLALVLAAVALAPAAQAEQACVHGRGTHCDDHLVCYYNRLTMQWDCHVEIYCLHSCGGPYLP